MTGKEKFKKEKDITSEEDVFTIFQSDDEDEDFMFEEYIEAMESNSYAEIYAVTKKEEIDEEDSLTEDFTRLASDSLSVNRTLKNLKILQNYINNEGNLPDPSPKCQECLKANCRTCQKIGRMDPMRSAVLDEMRENIEETVLPDNSIKCSVKYVTYKDLKYTFLPNVSNYNEALMQSKNNF